MRSRCSTLHNTEIPHYLQPVICNRFHLAQTVILGKGEKQFICECATAIRKLTQYHPFLRHQRRSVRIGLYYDIGGYGEKYNQATPARTRTEAGATMQALAQSQSMRTFVSSTNKKANAKRAHTRAYANNRSVASQLA